MINKVFKQRLRALKFAAKSAQADIQTHFKTRGHGWDLDAHHIASIVLDKYFGVSETVKVIAEMVAPTNTKVEYNYGIEKFGWTITKKRKKNVKRS